MYRPETYWENKAIAIKSAAKLRKLCDWTQRMILKKRKHDICLIPYIPDTKTYVFKDLDSTTPSFFVKEDQDRLHRSVRHGQPVTGHHYSGIASSTGNEFKNAKNICDSLFHQNVTIVILLLRILRFLPRRFGWSSLAYR